MKTKNIVIAVSVLLFLFSIPFVAKSPYFIHIMIMMAFNISLVLSYNFSVGEVGTLSLVHATFFGVGGYAAAIFAMKVFNGSSLLIEIIIALAFAAIIASIIGFLSFRLPDRSFAIGTLAFAMIGLQIAQNWVPVTNGPMCLVPVPKPVINLPFGITWQIISVREFYFFAIVLALLIFFFSTQLKKSRIGRAFNAVRESGALASSVGINVLKYKMLALILGASIAGIVGAIYAHYVKVFCPSELSFAMILNLLIMIYVGGVGSVRGAILGAVVFTWVPELLRAAPQFRMLLYGVILYLSNVFLPGGIDSVITKFFEKVKKSFTRDKLSGPSGNEEV